MKYDASDKHYYLSAAEVARVDSWERSDLGFAWNREPVTGGGVSLSFTGDGGQGRNHPTCKTFERDMARYGITVEEEAKVPNCGACESEARPADSFPCNDCRGLAPDKPSRFTPKGCAAKAPPPTRIDKHAVADAIEIAVGKCLVGSYTGKITDCKVCEIMGYREKTEEREPCQRCPLGPSVLPSCVVDFSSVYGCYGAMHDIVVKKPGASARVYAIIDSLRSTTGDDRWIEIEGKKRTVRREELADEIEGTVGRYLGGDSVARVSGGRRSCFSSRLCSIFGEDVDRRCEARNCPVSKHCQADTIDCTDRARLLRSRDIPTIRKMLNLAHNLRSQGGEIEL